MLNHSFGRQARQRGLSFFGLIFVGVLAVAAFAIGGQSIPIFLEMASIKKAVAKAAKEGGTPADVRASFDRAAAIDNIESVKGGDLEITKRNDKVVVGYKYAREIHLGGPAFLVYRFEEQVN